jgi:hypothetical protein
MLLTWSRRPANRRRHQGRIRVRRQSSTELGSSPNLFGVILQERASADVRGWPDLAGRRNNERRMLGSAWPRRKPRDEFEARE